MSDDLLQRATSALRTTTEPNPDGMDEMLLRLTDGKRRPTPRRTRARALVFALAASFVGAGAWAGVTGQLPRWSTAWLEPDGAAEAGSGTEAQPGSSSKRKSAGPPRSSPAQEIPTVLPAAPAPHSAAARVAPLNEPAKTQTEASKTRAPQNRSLDAAVGAPSASLNAPSASVGGPRVSSEADVNALYREAHRAHFSNHDPLQSLVLWDRYLEVAGPRGKMVVEARYNRAIALARLGRATDAVRALEPFAEGRYGEYRRDEARKLIEALGAPR